MRKKFLSLLIAAVMVLAMVPATAMAADTSGTSGGITWSYEDSVLTISAAASGNITETKDDGSAYVVGEMPDYARAKDGNNKNLDATTAPWFDYAEDITSIIIEDGVTSIGDYAFAYTAVETATFNESVTDYGICVYYKCTELTTINWDGFNPESINDEYVSDTVDDGAYIPFSMFDGCSSLNTCILDGEEYAEGKLVFPDNIEGVMTAAFRYTAFDTIESWGNIACVGPYAFYDTDLIEVTIPNSIYFYQQWDNTTNPPSRIQSRAFSNCTELITITIEDSGTTIPYGMFYGCTALENINGSKNIKEIGEYAFTSTGLTSLTLGEVSSIAGNAFSDCSKLTKVDIDGTSNLTITTNIFSDYNGSAAPIESFTLNNGTIEGFTSTAIASLQTLVLGDGVTSVPNSLCSGATKLANVTLGSGIISIGNNAFNGCISLKEITLPEKLETIGGGAFANCPIAYIDFPGTVKSIGDQAFYFNEDPDSDNADAFEIVYDMTALSANTLSVGDYTFYHYFKGAQDPDAIGRVFYIADAEMIDVVNDSSVIQPVLNAIFAITNGGLVDASNVSDVTEPVNPTKSGYIFKNWYEYDETYSDSEYESETPTTKFELNGTGTPNEYIAIYEASDYVIASDDLGFEQVNIETDDGDPTSYKLEFDPQTYGDINASAELSLKKNRESVTDDCIDSAKFVSGDTAAFEKVKFDSELNVTVSVKDGLDAGGYEATLRITTKDGATHDIVVSVTVDASDDLDVELTTDKTSLTGKQTIELTATVTGLVDGDTATVTISNSDGLTISSTSDTVTADENGEATVTFTVEIPDETAKYEFTVTVDAGDNYADTVTDTIIISVTESSDDSDDDNNTGNSSSSKSSHSSYSLSQTTGSSSSSSSSSTDEDDSSSTSGTTSTVFTNLSTDHPYYDAIMTAYENGWMVGTSGITFEPDAPLTRAMAAKILHNLAGNPDPEDVAPFLDVVSGEWYSDAIAWAYEQGLVVGYDHQTFGPDDYVTMEQFNIMLANLLGQVVPDYVGGAPYATRGWIAYMITA